MVFYMPEIEQNRRNGDDSPVGIERIQQQIQQKLQEVEMEMTARLGLKDCKLPFVANVDGKSKWR